MRVVVLTTFCVWIVCKMSRCCLFSFPREPSKRSGKQSLIFESSNGRFKR